MVTLEELLTPFAKSIHIKVSALKELDFNLQQRARFLEAISDDIKKCTNFISPEVSRATFERARNLGVELTNKFWHDQHKFDNGRKIFHFEHINPVVIIREACLGAPSASAILEVLLTRLRIAWILKEEDYRLTTLGYKSNRPDAEAAYREANIELLSKEDL
jgi:hypothetical protein